MPLYSKEVWICATVYVQAEDPQAAAERIAQNEMAEVTLSSNDVPVSGVPFDSPDMPEFSFSPVATVYWDLCSDTDPEPVE